MCLFLRLTAVYFSILSLVSMDFILSGGLKWSLHLRGALRRQTTHTHTNHTPFEIPSEIASQISLIPEPLEEILFWTGLSPSRFLQNTGFLTLFFLLDFVRHGVLPGVWHEKTHPRTFHKKKIGDWHCLDYVNSCLPILDPHSCLYQHLQVTFWTLITVATHADLYCGLEVTCF